MSKTKSRPKAKTEVMSKTKTKTKTKIVESSRHDYALSRGDPKLVHIKKPIGVDLELPASYARNLLVLLKDAIRDTESGYGMQIRIDMPILLQLHQTQVEQLIESLTEAAQ